jgi:hypothetical protein
MHAPQHDEPEHARLERHRRADLEDKVYVNKGYSQCVPVATARACRQNIAARAWEKSKASCQQTMDAPAWCEGRCEAAPVSLLRGIIGPRALLGRVQPQ